MYVEDVVDGGPGGAHAALVRRLHEALSSSPQIKTQAAVVKSTGLSKATVSNIFTMKAVPTVYTLGLLTDALGIRGQAEKELRQLRDRAETRTRRLDAYLVAAKRAAREHPYPGVLPGPVPALTSVYLRQQATRLTAGRFQTGDPQSQGVGVEELPPEEVAGRQTCVVLAGPGGGKSSFLQTCLSDGVERWIEGRGEGWVPVLVPAAALADRPLTQALAAAVTADLASRGLVEELPPAFFAGPAQPGVGWLVLVDGLDEVSDPAARSRILRTLAAVGDDRNAELYRFVVATRPLPAGELDTLDDRVPRYELHPFSRDDVERVACRWFRALDLPTPEATAKRFAQALHRTRLVDLARIPLMASMLCQLLAVAPDKSLPSSRGQLYRNFMTLLHDQQHRPSPAGVRAHAYSGLEHYGPSTLATAESTLDHLHDLITHLAAERHSGNTLPAISIIESRPEARRPPRVTPDAWRAFLDAGLRRSGLVTIRAGKLEFLHHTLLEYLAACHATRDLKTAAHTLHKVFHRPARYGPHSSVPGLRPRLWLSRYWKPPQMDPSFVGFVLDATQETDAASRNRYLSRLTSPRAGLPGYAFIAAQDQLGTYLAPHVRQSATAALHALANDPALSGHDRVRAAQLLADFDDPRASDMLYSLATNSTLNQGYRVAAARLLTDSGGPRAAEVLCALATDPNLNSHDRMWAAQLLADFDGPRASEMLYSLATDPTLDRGYRWRAVRLLAEPGGPQAAEVLHTLATDTTLDGHDRTRAAQLLADLNDTRTPEVLYTLATDTTLDGHDRTRARETLTALGDRRATGLEWADEPQNSGTHRSSGP
jgi:transcriptional regulator with XRE-family HTH domain